MRRILAIASIACRSAIRSRLVLAVSLLILAIIVALPMTIEGDGTVRGQVVITLHYTLTAVSFLLALVTIWLGCASISLEVQQRQIHLLHTKPVRPIELWLGKWLGLLTVNAGILVFTGIITLLVVGRTFQAGQFAGPQAKDALDEIWRARTPVAPIYNGLDQQVNAMVDERLLQGDLQDAPRSELEKAARGSLLNRLHTVAPQAKQTWTFSPNHYPSDIPQRLTYRLSVSSLGPMSVAGRWTLSQEGASERTFSVTNNPSRAAFVHIPADYIQPELPIQLSYQNLSDPPVTVILAPQDLHLLTYRHSLGVNLAKALTLVFFELAFLGAVGLTAGALFSLPVAALVSGYIILMLQANGYIERMAASADLLEGVNGFAEVIMQALFAGLNMLMLLLNDPPALDWLAEGTAISPSVLWVDGLTKLVLYSGLFALLGSTIYKRREIGLPS